MLENVEAGCCGFRSKQSEYYKTFRLVEVQHTFYEPPSPETLKKWRQSAPPDFEFTLKAWQRITHRGNSPTYRRVKTALTSDESAECGDFMPTETVQAAMQTTLRCADILDARKILFQCPAAFRPEEQNIENLREFFSRAPRKGGMQYLWEPRGSWPEALVKELCDELELVHVVNPFKQAPVTTGLYYYRVHGRGGHQSYTDAELDELQAAIIPGSETYVLFNNIYMIKDAKRFIDLLQLSKQRRNSSYF